MKKFKKLMMLLLTVFVLAGISGVSAVSVKAATGITGEEYWPKAWAFVQDERWRTGSSYGSRGPKLSSYSSSGCCAYAADYCAYVYGRYDAWRSSYFTSFYNASEIQSGDIIYTGTHWFVVVERNGSELMTAEGNTDRYGDGRFLAHCTRDHYKVENGCIVNMWYRSRPTVPIVQAYHYNFSQSNPTPGEPSLGARYSDDLSDVDFFWGATANTQYYNLVVCRQGSNTEVLRANGLTTTSYTKHLEAGSYYATLTAVNSSGSTVSPVISFDIPKGHRHTWKTKIKKATLKSSGSIWTGCDCGAKKPGSKTTSIPYPKTVKLSATTYQYNGYVKTPKVTVIGGNGKTISAQNYTVTYPAGRKKAGTYNVTIKFKGNYTGTVIRKFTISAKNHKHSYYTRTIRATLSKNGSIRRECNCGTWRTLQTIYCPKSVELSDVTYVYDGKVKTPKVNAIATNGKTISRSYYTVKYPSGRKNNGTYKITITFKGNYSGTVTRSFKIAPKGWIYADKLPTGVTSAKYQIQYKNTYNRKENYYADNGSIYDSQYPKATSDTVVYKGCYYYHFCSGWKGQTVNYAQTNDFVHFDSVNSDQVFEEKSGWDSEGNLPYYILKWNNSGNRVWCQSGVTCSGVAGAHGNRGYAWYKMYQYQNRVLTTRTVTKQSNWTTKKYSNATKVTYRYKLK